MNIKEFEVSSKTLIKFDKLIPGSGERILCLIETQTNHRIAAERRGQIMAFSIAVICILSALIAALYDREIFASIVSGTTILGLVTIFLRSEKKGK